ncbi:peptidase [Roseomonas sp. CCTCC AB2023176]|uniref:peptidase n=1 Tax=Roseomonas sp. CCTCC AB2023176 TaxID=3342640 RepID=UPI0035DF7A63
MTYCVGLYLEDGLVMLADTRTNAGVDNVSTFSKVYTSTVPGERALCLMSAGNLGITQAVWNRLQEGVMLEGTRQSLLTVPSMFRTAQLLGEAVRAVYAADGPALRAQGISFAASFLLGGQIAGGPVRLFLVYSAGNFIEATTDTPYLQVGEHKYGKPTLLRILTHRTRLEDGAKLSLLSMDDTLGANLSVGMPLDMVVYRKDSLAFPPIRRIEENDPYFHDLRDAWTSHIRDLFRDLPAPDWLVQPVDPAQTPA